MPLSDEFVNNVSTKNRKEALQDVLDLFEKRGVSQQDIFELLYFGQYVYAQGAGLTYGQVTNEMELHTKTPKLACGCRPRPKMKIIAHDKLTTAFLPRGLPCYKGSKAHILSVELSPEGIVNVTARTSRGPGTIIADAWSCRECNNK